MKEGTTVLLIVGGLALLFWAFSKGLLGVVPTGISINPATGQPYGAIAVPQPSTNYSGYLAASTAPQVSSVLNGALSGLGQGVNHLFSGWFGGSSQTPPTANNVGVAPTSTPALAASPSGPSPSYGVLTADMGTSTPVGPVIDPILSYNTTSGAAFDYTGLAAANAPDPGYSLTDPGLLSS